MTPAFFTSCNAQKGLKNKDFYPTNFIHSFYLSKSLIIGLLLLAAIGSVSGTNYYTSTNGAPENLNSWWTGTNGTGTHPANFTASGDNFIIQNGDVMTSAVGWVVTGSVTINSGGTLARGTQNITCSGLVINGTSTNANGGSFTINGNVSGTGTITAGIPQPVFNVTGDWTFSGTITNRDGISLNMNGTSNQILSGTISNGNYASILTINKTSGIVTLGSAINTGGGAFTLTSGTFDPTSYLLSATTFTFTAGTLRVGATTWANNYSGPITEPATGTIEYDALGNQTVNAVSYPGNLTISGSGIKTIAAAIPTVSGALTVRNGSTLALSTFPLGATNGPSSVIMEIGTTGSIISGTGAGILHLGGDVTVNYISGSSGATISCPINLDNNRNFIVANDLTSATDLTISGVLNNGSAAYGFTKSGPGTMLVSGANTYTGATAVNGGTLKAGSTQAFGLTSAVTLANTSGVILDITGFATTIGSLTGGGTTGGNVTLGAATLTIGSDNTSPAAYAGIISGTGAITKSGTGTLTLSGVNTFTGVPTVSAGTLKLGNSAALGTTAGNTTIATGAVLDLNGQSIGNEQLAISGTGSLINNSVSAASLSGNITGTYSVGGSGSILLTGNIQGTLTKVGTNTLTLGGTIDNVGLGVIANSGTVILAKASSTAPDLHAIGGGGLTIAGALVQLGGTGGDQIYNGCTVTLNSGTFDLNALSETITILTGTGGTILNNGGSASTLTFGSGGGTNTYAGIIANGTSGTGGLSLVQQGGTYTLSGLNTYSGSTIVNGGILKAGAVAQSFGINSAVTLANTAGVGLDITGFNTSIGSITGGGTTGGTVTLGAATLTLGSDNTSPAAYAGIISGTGTITKTGTGTLTLTGSNNFTGGLTVNSGTIQLGSVNCLSSSLPVTLNGGTLGTGSTIGLGNTVSTLTLTDNSTIALGTGLHILKFADSNLMSWTAGKLLTVTGWTGSYHGTSGTAGQLFVGTSSGLTSTQLSQIQFKDGSSNLFQAILLSTGEIVPAQTSATDYFRSKLTGNWSTAGNWQSSADNINWITSSMVPTSTATLITIQSTNAITVDVNNQTASALTIASGGILTTGSNALLVSSNWTNNGTFTASSGTVNLNGAAQTIAGTSTTTFNNLTLSNSGLKTLTTVPTVNSILSMEGTTTVSAAPTFGAAATLQYNTTTSRNTGAEWVSPFASTGGILIANTGIITLNAAKVLNASVPLTINSGATLTPGANLLTLGGNFTNGGTLTSGSGGVTITGTAAAQTISGFTTTGAVSMTKTAGTATFTGNVNGGDLTLVGTGGILNLGAGLSHTFTGTYTITGETLQGGSSTLNILGGLAGTGGSWIQQTSTVNYGGAAQSVYGVPYFNLVLSGSGVKTFSQTGITSLNNFTISGTASTTPLEGLPVTGNFTIGAGASFSAGSFTHNVAGNWQNNGTFTPGTSTVVLNGTTQSITGATSFNNLTLGGTGTKTFANATTTVGTFIVNSGVIANLGTGLTHTANSLTLGGLTRIGGIWGSTTATTAAHQDNTYFAATTGTITVATDTRSLTPTFSGLTSSQSICVGTSMVTLNGSVSAGSVYPAIGETVGITINGVLQNTTITTATGGFTINYPSTTIPTGTYNITYSYAGNTILKAAANNTTTALTVNLNTVTLTSAAGTNAQTLCINIPVTNITYATTVATGATVTGLPAGVTGSWAGNVVTISGTPTAAGTFTYTVTLTGGCSIITTTGTITVTPANTITLTSAAGTNVQTPCINTTITNITYATTGATGATVTGLPTGVTGNWAGNVVTISGTPTASGTFTYTVTLNGGCSVVTATGTITVNPLTSISSQSTGGQTQFQGSAFTPITVTASGVGLSYQWYSNSIAATTGGISLLAANGGQTTSYTPQSTAVGTLYYYCIVGGTCTNITSTISGAFIVNTQPVITTTGTLTAFTYAHGTITATNPSQQSFTVSGINLGANITITAPTDFEISTVSGAGFASTPTITLTPSSGTVSTTTIYVRLKVSSPVASYPSENIICSSTGASSKTVAAMGTVTAGTFYSIVTTGNWNNNTTWSLTSAGGAVGSGIYPLPGDVVYIQTNDNVTATDNAACASLTFTGTGGTLTVNSAFTATVSGAVTLNSANASYSNTITGTGTLSCSSLTLGTSVVPSAARTTILTSSITNLLISGNLTLYSSYSNPNTDNATFNLSTGTVTVNGSVTTTNATNSTSTLTMATGTQNGILILGGATPFSLTGGTSTITLSGTGATVNYAYLGAQTIGNYTYTNLTLSGSGLKTEGTTTVNGILSLEGAATISSNPTFGAAATLQYKGNVAQTTGPEFITPFTPTGGVIINNPNGVTLNAAKSFSSLTLRSGNLTTSGTNLLTITNTSTTAISGGSASSFINGPVKWSLPVLATGSTYVLPVGKGTTYLPFSLVNPITSGTTSAQVEAFAVSSGGSADGTTLNSISTTEYWSWVTVANFTNSSVSLSRPSTISPLNAIGSSTTATGSYAYFGGTVGAYGVSGSNATTGSPRFFVLANEPPTITTSTSSLSGFSYPVGYGPSSEQSFTVNGTSLTSNILVTPSASFEISTGSGASFVATNPITLIASGGIVNSTTIHVRMITGLALGAVAAENVAVTATGATTKNVACSGTIATAPVISTSITTFPTTFTYSYTAGPSSQQTFNVSGSNLIGNVIITPPADYEISTTTGTGFVSTPISLTPSGGNLSTTPIYARLKIGLGIGSYSESLVLTSASATTVNVICNGTITPAPSIITTPSFLSGFIYSGAGPSGQQSFVVTGSNLGTNVVTIAPPLNYEISTGSTFQTTALTLTPVSGSVNTTIYARLKSGLSVGTYGPANDSIKCTGAIIKTVAFSGSVVSSATILTSKTTLTGFGYMAGTGPSAEQTFTVSGASLSANIVVTPPANYEISTTTGSGFLSTPITLTQASGRVNPTLIYVRLKAGLSAGNYSGVNDTISSTGVTSQKIANVGTVFVSPLITAGGGGNYCAGSNIVLTSVGAEIINRYWQGPNGNYSTSQNDTIFNATAASSGTYNVTGNVTVGGNLITNGDFELGSFGIGSGYIYTVPGKTVNANGNLWPEGYFTVDNLPSTSHNNFSACVDHTSGSGKQMIINGAGVAGVVIWSQSVSVIPGATYQFSYWVQTISAAGNPSQLQLYVNGVAAGPTYTANAATCSWKQFIYNATSGSNTSLNLELINQNIALSGNDFALDDIVFTQILPATSSASVTVNPILPVSVIVAASANPVYSGTPVTFTATPTNGGTTPSYQWKVGSTTVGTNSPTYTYTPLNGDVVTCTLTSSNTCVTGNPASNAVTMTVTPRTNYWKGSIDTDWGKAGNWTANYIPLTGDDVEYATVSNYGSTAVNDLYLDIDRTIGNLINATTKGLVIPPAKGLIVNYTISTDGNPNRVYIQSSSSAANGSLTFHNMVSSPVNATVEMYSKASYNLSDPTPSNRYKWQYFGIPLRSVVANPTFYGSYVRKWYESGTTIANHWLQLGNDSVLNSFIGYEICQQAPTTIIFQGQLENGDYNSGQLAYTSTALYPGQHVFANPYTAAIDIRQLTFGTQTEASVYLYNTGTYNQWNTIGGQTSPGNNPGQYTASTKNTAGNLGVPRQVPSMQAMLVKAMSNAGSATFGVTYNSVVMNNTDQQRVAASMDSNSSDKVCTLIDVTGTNYSDRMWIFTDPTCTRVFDNGWDGSKLLGSALSPQIYAIEPDGNYQIDGVDDMNNTNLGFLAGQDVTYTFTFTQNNIKSKYAGVYLMDKVENKTIDITESGTTYSFLAESTAQAVNRFTIVTRPYEQGAPDKDSQLKMFSSKGTILVQNLSSESGSLIIYDIAGHYLKKVSLPPNGGITAVSGIIPGAYVAKAVTSKEGVTKRLIVQ